MGTALLRRTGRLRDGRPYLLRPELSEDAAALVALLDSVAAEGDFIAAAPGERSVLEQEASLSTLLAEGGLSIVAVVEDELAAHLLVRRGVPEDSARLAEVAILVHNACRGVGLGRLMMTVAIEWCRAVGVGTLCLGVFRNNERAIRLYHSLGFQDEGVTRLDGRHEQRGRELLLMGLQV